MDGKKKSIHDIVAQIGLKNIIIIGLCGIAIIVLTIWPDVNNNKKSIQNEKNNISDENIEKTDKDEYVCKVEKQLEQMFNKIPDAGPVSVMVTLKCGTKKIVLKNESVDGDNKSQSSVAVFDNDDGTYPYVISETQPQVEGIVIITSENASAKTISEISDAAMVLFSLDAHKIKVIKGD